VIAARGGSNHHLAKVRKQLLYSIQIDGHVVSFVLSRFDRDGVMFRVHERE